MSAGPVERPTLPFVIAFSNRLTTRKATGPIGSSLSVPCFLVMPTSMTAQEFNVRNATYRFQDLTANAAVEQASAIATEFIAAKGGSQQQGKHDALRAVAQECRISASALRKFIQPSRRPKSIGVDLWQRLRGGYIAFLRRQLLDIQTRIDAVEAMGTPGPDVLDLLDEAQALCRRIEKVVGE